MKKKSSNVAHLEVVTYYLQRNEDVHGVSGTGRVAIVVQLPSKKCVVEWFGSYRTQTVFEDIDQVLKVHGHEGKTILEPVSRVYLDQKETKCQKKNSQ